MRKSETQHFFVRPASVPRSALVSAGTSQFSRAFPGAVLLFACIATVVHVNSRCGLALEVIAAEGDFSERFSDWPVETKINGRVLLGKDIGKAATVLRDLVLEDSTPVALLHFGEDAERQLRRIQEFAPAAFLVENAGRLMEVSAEATVVVVSAVTGGEQEILKSVPALATALLRVIDKGGTVLLCGESVALAG